MAIKKESIEIKDEVTTADEDLIQKIKREAFEEALKAIKSENERIQKEKEEAEKNKTLYGYNITLTYMNYNSVHKVAEFLVVNDEVSEHFLVPEGVPTDVSLAVCEILDEHLQKNLKNEKSIMYRYVKNYKVFK